MKAAVIYENGGPGVLRHQDVADPGCPDGCVVVDAEAISIEGGDLLARAAGQLPAVPHRPGDHHALSRVAVHSASAWLTSSALPVTGWPSGPVVVSSRPMRVGNPSRAA